MPAGDAQRTWFPEMIAVLRNDWNQSLSWPEIILLRDRLNTMLQAIRAERNIRPPIIWCPTCQKRHRAAPPELSVAALILALSRFGLEEEQVVKNLRKHWQQYRKEKGLDLYGADHPPTRTN